jgi:hypothetical protein
LDPSYVAGLDRLPLSEVRARRAACNQLETDLSYLRRLVQGRIDIIVAEAGQVPGDVDLVDRLPEILSEHDRPPGVGRLSTLLAPSEEEQSALTARLDEAFSVADQESIARMDRSEIDAALGRLSDLERDVSSERRALHDILDQLQEEIVRRYRSGEASVDTLLQ